MGKKAMEVCREDTEMASESISEGLNVLHDTLAYVLYLPLGIPCQYPGVVRNGKVELPL